MDEQFVRIIREVRSEMGPDCPLGTCTTTDINLTHNVAVYGLTCSVSHQDSVLQALKVAAPRVLGAVGGIVPEMQYD